MPLEGEHDSGDLNTITLQPGSQCTKTRQREESQNESDGEAQASRKLQKKNPVNYKQLNDPFSEEEESNETYNTYSTMIYQATLGPDDPRSLNMAKGFNDWAEWEKAIHAELEQLEKFGTWKLVDCPSDAIPIPNKWVLRKKYNKEGELTK